MSLLILGLILWYVSHLAKRVVPGLRAKMGETPGKLAMTALSILSLYLMVKGYRNAAVIEVWTPPDFLRHLNNLLMLVAVFLLNLGYSRGQLRARIRHPMLTAAKTWAIAHLLVKGDVASIVLFGAIFGWALINLILTNRQEPVWNRPPAGPVRNDLIYGVAAVALFALIVWIHGWLGYPPLG